MLRTVRSRTHVGLAALTALVLTALAVGPVLADDEMGHTGTPGFHVLRDDI